MRLAVQVASVRLIFTIHLPVSQNAKSAEEKLAAMLKSPQAASALLSTPAHQITVVAVEAAVLQILLPPSSPPASPPLLLPLAPSGAEALDAVNNNVHEILPFWQQTLGSAFGSACAIIVGIACRFAYDFIRRAQYHPTPNGETPAAKKKRLVVQVLRWKKKTPTSSVEM